MKTVEDRFLQLRVNVDSDGPALPKPLLLLFALGRLLRGEGKMLAFSEVDSELYRLFLRFFPKGSFSSNTHYPFGKLQNDGV